MNRTSTRASDGVLRRMARINRKIRTGITTVMVTLMLALTPAMAYAEEQPGPNLDYNKEMPAPVTAVLSNITSGWLNLCAVAGIILLGFGMIKIAGGNKGIGWSAFGGGIFLALLGFGRESFINTIISTFSGLFS